MSTSPFLLMAIPAVVALVGGLLAAVWSPGHQPRSMIQHFAAGVVLAALAVELLFLGLALASDQIRGWKIVAVSGALGLTVLGCALAGSLLLAQASHDTIGTVLSFSAAALLYLVTEELLMEAHEVEEKSYFTLILFGGFLTFWCIQLLGQG
ncbi:hypothetical protein [Brachymonas sp. J145]|uniref:hypothetical protein n=1 Tax=Brachymonas sp. J145 TaxID=3116489 RepID=UPI002E7A86F2|nr:hypothetical protein [Brachymonas sp. J145]MEE1654120.1 hypothetical protein [Brachymonas sp. J145]